MNPAESEASGASNSRARSLRVSTGEPVNVMIQASSVGFKSGQNLRSWLHAHIKNATLKTLAPASENLVQTLAIFALSASLFSAAGYTTYIGDAFPYQVTAMATDANGNTYLTGTRTINALTDVFVTKVDTSGNITLLTTLSGKGDDTANGIAIDSSGNIFVAGVTTSPDFPIYHALQAAIAILQGNPQPTGFLTKLAPDGGVLFSTFLGGTLGQSSMSSVAVDAKGDVYVTGTTQASDYPHTPGLPAGTVTPGLDAVSAAFFAKISATGDSVIYAGGISSTMHECGAGSLCTLSAIATNGVSVAVDGSGDAYVAGNSYGGLTGTPGALRTNGIGAFVAKIAAGGSSLSYMTPLGAGNYPLGGNSAPYNLVSAIAVDAAGNAYLTGTTQDPNFPVTQGAFQTTLPGENLPVPILPSSGFVAKLNPTGSAMVWASFLGGTSNDSGQAIAIDSAGNAWISGMTASTDFPASLGWPGGGEFLAEFNASGSALLYAARFPSQSVAAAVSLDANGNIHAAGSTGMVSSFAPGAAPGQAFAPLILGVLNAAGSVLAGRIVSGEIISIYGLNIGPSTPATAQVVNNALPGTLAGVQVTIGGFPAPLLYVSSTQINAVVPAELTGTQAALHLAYNSAAVDLKLVLDAAAPQVFRNPASYAVALNQDSTVNSEYNPAKSGTYVTIWATGVGPFPGGDGQIASGAANYCSCIITDTSGNTYPVSYAGSAPGEVNGAVQINFILPMVPSSQPLPGALIQFQLAVARIKSDLFGIFVSP